MLDGNEENIKRIDELKSRYIGDLNLITMTTNTKLELNINNNIFYKRYLSTLSISKINLSTTNKLMYQCFKYFNERFENKFKDVLSILRFIEIINNHVYFTKMEVDNEVNAYTVFETLNARGVELSTSDLLKNYLFSIIDKTEDLYLLNEAESFWNNIQSTLGRFKFSDFIYVYWNGKYDSKSKKELFRAFRSIIKTDKDVFELLRDLDKKAQYYVYLYDYNNPYWDDKESCREYLRVIRLLNLTQQYSLLIHAIDILDVRDFEKLLKYILNSSFRYITICRKDAKTQSYIFNEYSKKMIKNNTFDFDGYLKSKVIVDDDEFVSSFKYRDFSDNKNDIVKYILVSIEKFQGTRGINEKDFSVEHILPKSFSEKWGKDSNYIDNYAFKLGNLVLLEQNLNKDCDKKSFVEKKKFYQKSIVPSTIEIGNSNSDNWTSDDILKRQNDLSKLAKGYWSF
jgi:hypothetical protein